MPLLALARYRDDPQLSAHIVDLSQYYRDVSRSQLPAVSYINVVDRAGAAEPGQGQPAGPRGRQRAHRRARLAQLGLPSAVRQLRRVVRPRAAAADRGRTVGLRVPALLISPYVRPGTVDHRTYDAASVLGFIERTWQVVPLAQRDRGRG